MFSLLTSFTSVIFMIFNSIQYFLLFYSADNVPHASVIKVVLPEASF